jgi:hypothetical protein
VVRARGCARLVVVVVVGDRRAQHLVVGQHRPEEIDPQLWGVVGDVMHARMRCTAPRRLATCRRRVRLTREDSRAPGWGQGWV